jgi:tetratricopeptide (TPR) repeat protein
MPAVSAPRVTTPPPRTSATYRAVTLPLRVQPSAVAPSDTSDLRDLVTQHAQLVDAGADHFALLGVTREEPPDRVRAAYFALARRLHPDRISAARLDDLRPVAQRVFAQVNAAFSTLSDPGRRAAYVSTLAAGGAAAVARAQDAADERASRIVLAEEQFRAGEAALRRNQLEAAVAAFKQAVELNPAECEHHALLAWTTFCLASDKPAAAKAARGALRRASEMSDKNPLPHLYLGKVARTVGDDEAAARHFRDCLTAMPGHVDATTELRVIEARLGTGGGKPRETGSKGLLGLLKR